MVLGWQERGGGGGGIQFVELCSLCQSISKLKTLIHDRDYL